MASPTLPVSVPLGQGVGTAGDHGLFFPYKSEWVWRDHPGAVKKTDAVACLARRGLYHPPRISHTGAGGESASRELGPKFQYFVWLVEGPVAHADVRSPMIHII